MRSRSFLVSLLACLAVASCATKPGKLSTLTTSYAPASGEQGHLAAEDPVKMEPTAWMKPHSPIDEEGSPAGGNLGGRTLDVGSISDIKLHDKEVILTFDDGPAPGKTEKILDILDRFHVKASFMMVGQMAKNHPEIAREVLARGHSIGSHTFSHKKLAALNFDSALAEISKGEKAVSEAVDTPVDFFRFPYLADTRPLRKALAVRGTVVMDVDIDSKDYFKTSPGAVMARTMNLVERRHKGIILMHDIHNRTATMLPLLLAKLQSEGYQVVTLRYKRSRMPEGGMIASAH